MATRYFPISFLFISLACFASAQNKNVQVNGYIDAYYEHNFVSSGSGQTLNGRGLDTRNDELSLAFVELDFTKPANPAGPGFTAMFYGGRGPDLIHLTEPGGKNKYKWIRQAYVTYQSSGKNRITIDLGKYDTWIGYEGIDNRYQDQYSRSFNWTYSETTYETGLRASTKLNDKLSCAFYLVQGWNEVEDSNNGKSWGVTLSYSPDSNTTYTLQNHSGTEGSNHANDVGSFGGIAFPNPGTSHVDLIDFIVSHQVNPKLKTAFNVDYADSHNAPNKGKWNGEDLYLKDSLDKIQDATVRFDRFEDNDGLRTGTRAKLYSLTGGYDRLLSNCFTLRIESRHDISDIPFFIGNDGAANKDRNTFTVAVIGKF